MGSETHTDTDNESGRLLGSDSDGHPSLEKDRVSSLESDQLAILRQHHASRAKWRCKALLVFLWVCSCIVSALTGAFVVSEYNSQRRKEIGTFSDGFKTDFRPAKSSIKITTRQFTGSPLFRDDGEEYIPPDSPSVAYIGATAEVDTAWDDLTEARYFLLTDEEAQTAWGADYRRYWDGKRGGYLGGLDMFHLIHCLDYLRKALHPDVYTLRKIHGPLHQLHCIDHLRQLVQCSADLTIIPTIYHPGIHHNYIDGDQVHTCRDFETVHSWVKDRYNGPEAVKPRHPNGTVREAFVDMSEEGMPVEF